MKIRRVVRKGQREIYAFLKRRREEDHVVIAEKNLRQWAHRNMAGAVRYVRDLERASRNQLDRLRTVSTRRYEQYLRFCLAGVNSRTAGDLVGVIFA